MDSSFLLSLVSICIINLVLSGDNAVVIALACRNLSPKMQNLGIIYGTLGAVILRVVLTVVAAWLLTLPYIKTLGGLALVWIAIKLVAEEDDSEDVEAASNLWGAVKTIIVADFVMSLDNVLGVAAAAKGNDVLLILGLAISIPIVVFCSKIIMAIMKRFPVIILVGAAIIGYTAGEMITTEKFIEHFIMNAAPILEKIIPLVLAALVVVVGLKSSHSKEKETANS